MRRGQIVAVMICILLNALDGFDVLSISFASPGIAAQWRVDRAALGVVLSMELIGMAGGSILLGTLCDRWGRRPTILTCLLVMGIGMSLASVANSIASLSLFRLFTGVGIGGMLAATNAATAEFANARHRDLAVALMAAGYPFGAVVGGSMASVLLVTHSWRSIFVLGATASFVAIPFVLFLLPETVAFLGRRQQPDALQRVNRALRLLSHAPVERLSPPDPGALKGAPLRQLFSPTLRRTTFCLMLAYVAQILTFYFILKWTPKIVVDMGFAPSMAGTVLVWANIGGLAGSIALSLLTRVAPLRWLTLGSMILSTMLVALFGRSAPDLHQLALLAAIAGFCTNAGMVGLYALVAASFPSEARASGTGLVIGIGRGGAALSPVLAGLLFQAGVSLPTVALVMAFGSIIAAAAVFGMRPIRSR
ncbi:MAG TPA: MFS transporter [Sphingomonas sp.]|nr:MFS transporter [Sphingomonas sp.]